jgi:endonuclease-3
MAGEPPTKNQSALTTALEVHRRLALLYGQAPKPSVDPLEALVLTILSQNTNDVNRDRAFRRLRDKFPTWEAILQSPEDQIVEAIRPAGLAKIKAPRIKGALQAVMERAGRLDLSFICDMPLDEARKWLTSLKGIGPKTAAIVLLFACGHEAFPVDTHIYRVTRRLGLVPWKATREKAHQILEELLPAEIYYQFHINLIEHGRRVCKAPKPLCTACVLKDLCLYYSSSVTGATATATPASTT